MEVYESLKNKIAGYHPTPEALDPIRKTPILFLIGISGAGKDTVLRRLMAEHPDDYRFIVSHTTRKPRENHGIMEQDGVDYHYVDLETVERMLDEHAFIEAKIYADNVYGTSIDEIKRAEDEGKIALGDLTISGAEEYATFKLNARNVFLLPPSYEVWQQRFMSRYEGKNLQPRDFYMRVKTAEAELVHALATDDFYIVVNDQLDKTVEVVSKIARGEEVERHYHKAVAIAEQMLESIRKQLVGMEK